MAIDIEHDLYEGLLTMDDFDDCIIGVVKGCGVENKVCYSHHKVIAKLMREDEMTEEDALDHFYYNNQWKVRLLLNPLAEVRM